MSYFRTAAALTLGIVLTTAVLPARADDDDDHDRAFGAVERGEALSLPEVMARAKQQLRGEVVGTAFTREHGRWIYEFKVVAPGGKLRRVYVDAASGKPVRDDDD
ncbi:PepSY domain-containing protein [Lichenifustis flavocetrariae]|uniref:PepSY domain-containing protein n=1 Tax=Lichenifustis flavocetrariae TaxID=2949735 RepID=A0AA42CMG2_9HYPH|nr:PepSY domain-containing protein [Lichenifustis flavocetrariae]MCW6512649.1 PepSY domain-containing protein [Lichenifustis flavocetrariae]